MPPGSWAIGIAARPSKSRAGALGMRCVARATDRVVQGEIYSHLLFHRELQRGLLGRHAVTLT